MRIHCTNYTISTDILGAGKTRWYFSNNFYTIHTLVHELKKFTDDEYHLIGRMKLNIVDKYNFKNLKEAISIITKYDIGGDWDVVHVCNPR